MTDNELLNLIPLFKIYFPYYDKHPTILIDDDVIKNALTDAETRINKKCKTLRSAILVNTAMHIILKNVTDEEAFTNGEFEELGELKGFEVGDIKVENGIDTKGKKTPKWWGSTKYGLEAWRLLLSCVKSRVGLIV